MDRPRDEEGMFASGERERRREDKIKRRQEAGQDQEEKGGKRGQRFDRGELTTNRSPDRMPKMPLQAGCVRRAPGRVVCCHRWLLRGGLKL